MMVWKEDFRPSAHRLPCVKERMPRISCMTEVFQRAAHHRRQIVSIKVVEPACVCLAGKAGLTFNSTANVHIEKVPAAGIMPACRA